MAEKLSSQIIEKITTLIITAFGLVAALAWNTAIQTTFQKFYGTSGSLIGVYIYAIVVTVLAVILTIWISRLKPK